MKGGRELGRELTFLFWFRGFSKDNSIDSKLEVCFALKPNVFVGYL